MQITNAKYNWNLDKTGNGEVVKATIDGVEIEVPVNLENRHYDAILKWVAEGNTIQDAD